MHLSSPVSAARHDLVSRVHSGMALFAREVTFPGCSRRRSFSREQSTPGRGYWEKKENVVPSGIADLEVGHQYLA